MCVDRALVETRPVLWSCAPPVVFRYNSESCVGRMRRPDAVLLVLYANGSLGDRDIERACTHPLANELPAFWSGFLTYSAPSCDDIAWCR